MAFSASETGVVAYKTITKNNVPDSLGWLDQSGRLLERLGPFPFERFGIVTLSPDGTHLAMQAGRGPDPQSDIWLFDLARRLPTQLTFADGTDRAMVWSSDGQQVAFTSLRAEAPGIYSKAVRGERPEELLLPSMDRLWEEHWPTTGRIWHRSSFSPIGPPCCTRDRTDVDVCRSPAESDAR